MRIYLFFLNLDQILRRRLLPFLLLLLSLALRVRVRILRHVRRAPAAHARATLALLLNGCAQLNPKLDLTRRFEGLPLVVGVQREPLGVGRFPTKDKEWDPGEGCSR